MSEGRPGANDDTDDAMDSDYDPLDFNENEPAGDDENDPDTEMD